MFLKVPLHDYSSDSADAFRYASIVANKKFKRAPTPHESIARAIQINSQHTLGEMFEHNEQRMNKSSFKSRRI